MGKQVDSTKIIKVSKTSDTLKVAGAIRHFLRTNDFILVQAIGTTSVNLAVKALSQLSSVFNFKYYTKISYRKINFSTEEQKTAVEFKVFKDTN